MEQIKSNCHNRILVLPISIFLHEELFSLEEELLDVGITCSIVYKDAAMYFLYWIKNRSVTWTRSLITNPDPWTLGRVWTQKLILLDPDITWNQWFTRYKLLCRILFFGFAYKLLYWNTVFFLPPSLGLSCCLPPKVAIITIFPHPTIIYYHVFLFSNHLYFFHMWSCCWPRLRPNPQLTYRPEESYSSKDTRPEPNLGLDKNLDPIPFWAQGPGWLVTEPKPTL